MSRVRNDLTIYDTHAADWWKPRSAFSCSLQAVNRLCLDEIVQVLGDDLHGVVVADLGCGGGLLAHPLAERGATVLAGDLSQPSVREARRHAGHAGVCVVVADACLPPFPSACADVVLCADILEHIPTWRTALAQAAGLLKPDGRIFVSTLTRSWWSALVAVHLGEGLGFVPRGTHDPAMFLTPDEVADYGMRLGLACSPAVGFTPSLLPSLLTGELRLRRTKRVQVGYGMWLHRAAQLSRDS
ncbi:MAG: 3-demethylubiquinone-9 3-O-methyltransferase [Planctomycetes bacterium]|nr:3-demethylubiquinone-9 3-O-methyltransferase [Planctomycetota bacterium]